MKSLPELLQRGEEIDLQMKKDEAIWMYQHVYRDPFTIVNDISTNITSTDINYSCLHRIANLYINIPYSTLKRRKKIRKEPSVYKLTDRDLKILNNCLYSTIKNNKKLSFPNKEEEEVLRSKKQSAMNINDESSDLSTLVQITPIKDTSDINNSSDLSSLHSITLNDISSDLQTMIHTSLSLSD